MEKVPGEFDSTLEKLRRFLPRTRELAWRENSLRHLAEVIRVRDVDIHEALANDLGKPEFEAYVTEIAFVLEEIYEACRELRTWAAPKRVRTPLKLWPAHSETRHVPKGAVAILAPWNYPFQLALAPLVAAVAAGCACVLKPSELAPHTARVLESIVREVWPDGEIVTVLGDGTVAQSLLDRPWDHVFFTGGTEIGRKVMMTCAKHLTPVTLELGGKSPCVIDRDVDLTVASRRVVWGKSVNSGQTCIAPDYLIVHQDVRDAFVAEMKNRIAEFFGENPLVSKSYGSIISDRHFTRLETLLEGAKVLAGGQRDPKTRRFAPTLVEISDATSPAWAESPLLNEEIFGPILPVLTWSKPDELEAILRRHRRPLAFYIFTRDKKFAKGLLENHLYGGAAVNDTLVHISNSELPFGGIGESGIGAYHGRYGFETFSHQASIVKRGFSFDWRIRYPPYGTTWKRLKGLM